MKLLVDCNHFGTLDLLVPVVFTSIPFLFLVAVSLYLLRQYTRAGGAAFVARFIDRRFGRWEALRRAVPLARPFDWTDGSTVRLQGTIESPEVLAAPAALERAVLKQGSTVDRAGRLVARGSRTIDPVLVLPDGERVRLKCIEAVSHDALDLCSDEFTLTRDRDGFGQCSWSFEQRLYEGQIVEVVGQLEREIDPSVSAVRPRALPLAWVLGGTLERPLAIACSKASTERSLNVVATDVVPLYAGIAAVAFFVSALVAHLGG